MCKHELQGLRLLGGVLTPGFQPALRLDLRPLRRLHTLFMLPGWVSVSSLPSCPGVPQSLAAMVAAADAPA